MLVEVMEEKGATVAMATKENLEQMAVTPQKAQVEQVGKMAAMGGMAGTLPAVQMEQQVDL